MDYTTNVNNFESEVRAVIGGDPGPIRTDESIHRFSTSGKRGDKSGWYVAYANGDFVAGVFGDWREGLTRNYCSKNGTRTTEETLFFKKSLADAEEQRQKVQRKATDRAKFIWRKAADVETHLYLETKGIKAHGAKVYKGMLVVPVHDKDGAIISLQYITPDGNKRFLRGGKTSGGRYLIHGEGDPIICEGFATGASIAEATGRPVVVAFNAGNLLKVAEPGQTITGDNDQWTTDRNGEPWNPGRQKALTAAWQHNCLVAIPTFSDTETQRTDFNDLHSLSGLDVVRAQIGGAVYAHEYLLRECESDVGAGYRSEHANGLKIYKERNLAGYMRLRAKLKRLKIGVTELEKNLKSARNDSGEAVNHLTLAREVVADYGDENLIHSAAFTWRWNNTGVWCVMDDREMKKTIHTIAENALDDPTKTIIDSVLDLAKTEIFVPNHQWDVNQTTINCLNGELSWTGSEWILHPHSREHFRTTQIPVAYDVNATAPRTEQFLCEVTEGDPDSNQKRILACEAIGYTLLSSTKFEKFFLLIGSGANGKSVLMDVVAELVGFRNVCAVQPSQFENRFQRAHLHNKLMNCVTELAQGAEIQDAQLKAIVSGEITTAEHKHKPPFDFQPYATCWFGSNHMPHTRDFSDALFRRAVIIPFNRVFPESEQDKNLKDKLKTELPGILNFALEGIAGVFERGYFTETQSSTDAKKEWRINADQAAEFAADECRFGAGLSIESGHLYEAYKRWAEDAGIRKTLNRKNFTQRIERLGAGQTRGTGGVRTLAGIDLANIGI